MYITNKLIINLPDIESNKIHSTMTNNDNQAMRKMSGKGAEQQGAEEYQKVVDVEELVTWEG